MEEDRERELISSVWRRERMNFHYGKIVAVAAVTVMVLRMAAKAVSTAAAAAVLVAAAGEVMTAAAAASTLKLVPWARSVGAAVAAAEAVAER